MNAIGQLGSLVWESLTYELLHLIPNLFYSIWWGLAHIIQVIEKMFRTLAGVEPSAKGGGDLVIDIINNNNNVERIFFNLMAVAALLMVFFTILQIIRENYKNKEGSNPYIIVFRMFKGLTLFMFITAACLVGLQLSGVVLKTLDKATGGGEVSITKEVFKAMAYNGNMARVGQGSVGGVTKDRFDALFGVNEGKESDYTYYVSKNQLGMFMDNKPPETGVDDANAVVRLAKLAGFSDGNLKDKQWIKVFSENEDFVKTLSEKIDDLVVGDVEGYEKAYLYVWTKGWFFSVAGSEWTYSGRADYMDIRCVGQLYDMVKFDWLIGFGGLFIVGGVFLNFIFGLVQRIANLCVLYIMSPLTLAFFPFDDGKAFTGQFVQPFYKQAISAYAIILSLNVFFLVYKAIKGSIEFDSLDNPIMNITANVIVSLALLGTLPKMRSTIQTMLGADSIEEKKFGEVMKKGFNTFTGADKIKKGYDRANKLMQEKINPALKNYQHNKNFGLQTQSAKDKFKALRKSKVTDEDINKYMEKNKMTDRTKAEEELYKKRNKKLAEAQENYENLKEMGGGHGALWNTFFRAGTGIAWQSKLGKSIDQLGLHSYLQDAEKFEKEVGAREYTKALGAGKRRAELMKAVDNMQRLDRLEKDKNLYLSEFGEDADAGRREVILKGYKNKLKHMDKNSDEAVELKGKITNLERLNKFDNYGKFEDVYNTDVDRYTNVVAKAGRTVGKSEEEMRAIGREIEKTSGHVSDFSKVQMAFVTGKVKDYMGERGDGTIIDESLFKLIDEKTGKIDKARFSKYQKEVYAPIDDIVYQDEAGSAVRDQFEKIGDRLQGVNAQRMAMEQMKSIQNSLSEVAPYVGDLVTTGVLADAMKKSGGLFEVGYKLEEHAKGNTVRFSDNDEKDAQINQVLGSMDMSVVKQLSDIFQQTIGNPYGEMRGSGVSTANNIISAAVYAQLADHASNAFGSQITLNDGVITNMYADTKKAMSDSMKAMEEGFVDFFGELKGKYHIDPKGDDATNAKEYARFAKDFENMLESNKKVDKDGNVTHYDDKGQIIDAQTVLEIRRDIKQYKSFEGTINEANQMNENNNTLKQLQADVKRTQLGVLQALKYGKDRTM